MIEHVFGWDREECALYRTTVAALPRSSTILCPSTVSNGDVRSEQVRAVLFMMATIRESSVGRIVCLMSKGHYYSYENDLQRFETYSQGLRMPTPVVATSQKDIETSLPKLEASHVSRDTTANKGNILVDWYSKGMTIVFQGSH